MTRISHRAGSPTSPSSEEPKILNRTAGREKSLRLVRLFGLGLRWLVGIVGLRQQFEHDFARARANRFVGISAKFLQRAAQEVIAVVGLGFSRAAFELADEFIPDAVQLARGERDVVPLNVGLGEKLVEKDAAIAV